MQVLAINQKNSFDGKTKKTEKGNEYKSTNAAKIVLPVLSAIGLLSEKAEGRKIKLGNAAFTLGLNIGIGFLLDNYVNKTRKSDVDIFAQTGKVKNKTHKGLGIGTAIGTGFGLIYSLALMAISKTKSAKLLLLYTPLCAVGGLLDGWLFYDLGVNKTRKQLAQKAEIKKEIEQTINKKTEEKISTKKSV